jgi:hypothetical protein
MEELRIDIKIPKVQGKYIGKIFLMVPIFHLQTTGRQSFTLRYLSLLMET